MSARTIHPRPPGTQESEPTALSVQSRADARSIESTQLTSAALSTSPLDPHSPALRPRATRNRPPPATRGAWPPPPAGDTRAPARSDPGAARCPPRAALNRVPTRTSALPRYLSPAGGGESAIADSGVEFWGRIAGAGAHSQPCNASLRLSHVTGGHKDPNWRDSDAKLPGLL